MHGVVAAVAELGEEAVADAGGAGRGGLLAGRGDGGGGADREDRGDEAAERRIARLYARAVRTASVPVRQCPLTSTSASTASRRRA